MAGRAADPRGRARRPTAMANVGRRGRLPRVPGPALQHFTRVPVPYLREHAEGFVEQAPQLWTSGQAALFAVIDHTDAAVGACGLMGVDPGAREAGAGYWVAPWVRGRGVARHALTVLTKWALHEGGLDRVFLEIEEENAPSVAVAYAAGYLKAPDPPREEPMKGSLRYFTVFERARLVDPARGNAST